jgi:diguanylate cyclase (GGDEF)-like protein
MNIYALFPLIATIAYIPLFISTIRSRPWRMQHKLFTLFLSAAMIWSLTDYFFRGNFFPQYNFLLFKIIVIVFTWMVVQFYCFASSFYPSGTGRWLPVAYGSLAFIITLVMLGYVPEGVIASGDKLYPVYGTGWVFIAVPLLTLLVRNVYLFWKRLRILDNPVLHNQIVSLLVSIFVLAAFTFAAVFLPWKEFPISHFGNLIVAFILSYATIRHQLVDIRFVLRRALTWTTLGIIGGASFWLSLVALHTLLRFEISFTATFVATAVAVLVAIFIYNLRGFIFARLSKAFNGRSYDYRQELSNFASRIHNVFSFREQGGELLTLVTKAMGCSKACLLFVEVGSEDFTAQLVEPKSEDNPLSNLRLQKHNPIVEYLRGEHKPLTRQNLAILPQFLSLWETEKKEIQSKGIELFIPLVSRGGLIGILVLDKKQSGRYLLGDFRLLEDVAKQVAVSMEKEYLREQLRQREEELSIIARSSAIITSSLDIRKIYDSFIKELKELVDVSWAAIIVIEDHEIYFMTLSSEVGSAWQVGERIPVKGTAIEWVAARRKALIQSDLLEEKRFTMDKYYLEQGLRSVIYLPLIVNAEVTGGLVVASCHPNVYSKRHIKLLEELASQITTSIENSRLYAKAEQRARIDGLTGLLNRRSLDELIASEINRHSRYGGVLSIIILDLDYFKAFNDNYGHLAGDTVLRQIGGIMKSSIRSADQAFRYGGDEFAILLPQTNIEAAHDVAERLRKRITSELKVGYVPVTTSIGLASWPADGIGPNEIIAAADAALYNAKRSGGNQSHRASGTLLALDDTMVGFGSNGGSEALSTIYALAATVDARDHYTRSHSRKVNEYAVALAEALNLEPLEITRLSTCALLHDIGKIGISDEILNKPGKLTAEEWEAIKSHPQLGATIVGRVRELVPCVPGILHHHEKYDGSGYPKGLKGKDIPLEARILAIADAFAAMTSERRYSDILSYEQALVEVKRGAGTQFDPDLVKVFLRLVKITIPRYRKREYEEVKYLEEK